MPNGTVPNGTKIKITIMIYKFDILFRKVLKSGGVKVVTYSNLLEDPEAFGAGEGFLMPKVSSPWCWRGRRQGLALMR